jgi:hypothetical protein
MLFIAFSYLFRLLTRGEDLELNCITMHSHTGSEYRILAFAGMLADIFLSMVAPSAIYRKSFGLVSHSSCTSTVPPCWNRLSLLCHVNRGLHFTSSGNRSMEVYA